MRVAVIRFLLPAVLLGMVLCAMPVQQSLGQDQTETYQLKKVSVTSRPVRSSAPAQLANRAVPTAGTALYLPLALGAPRLGPIQFAAAANDQGLINPASTFAFGLQTIYFGALAEGFPIDTPYRIEFSFPAISGETSDVIEDVTIDDPDNIFYRFNIVDRATGQPTGTPLPRGAYTVRFFVDNQLLQQATAFIQ